MIWFNLKSLESKISNNELSDKDGFNYLLANAIVTIIAVNITTGKDSATWMLLTGFFLALLITIWGINAAFSANNAIDGKDFLKRYLAISWVISMRIFVVILGVALISGIVMGILTAMNGEDNYTNSPIKDVIIMTITAFVSFICYLLIVNSFKRLKPQESL